MKNVKFDYRHIICVVITLGFVLCSVFLFPYAFGRLTESIRDFGLSVAYYFVELFSLDFEITPTVSGFSKYPFVVPFGLPDTWEEFQVAWSNYWVKWTSNDNFNGYLDKLSDLAYVLSQIIMIIIPLVLLLHLFSFSQSYFVSVILLLVCLFDVYCCIFKIYFSVF